MGSDIALGFLAINEICNSSGLERNTVIINVTFEIPSKYPVNIRLRSQLKIFFWDKEKSSELGIKNCQVLATPT